LLHLVLVDDARALVSEANGVASVEDGNHHLGEARVDEILCDLQDNGEGDLSTGCLGVAIDGGCERADELARLDRLDVDDARRAQKIVIDGNPRRAMYKRVIEIHVNQYASNHSGIFAKMHKTR